MKNSKTKKYSNIIAPIQAPVHVPIQAPVHVPIQSPVQTASINGEESSHYLAKRGLVIQKSNHNPSLLEDIKRELTVKPFIQEEFSGNVESFKVFLENDKKLYLPRFYSEEKFGITPSMKLLSGDDISLLWNNTKYPLRANQQVVYDVVQFKVPLVRPNSRGENVGGGGILALPCGFGKTILGLYLCANYFRKKTLIIVHKEFLLNQWRERIRDFLPSARIGIIQQNTFDIANQDIVIGMLQTISMKDFPLDAFDSFGLTIIDESHRIPCQVFSKALFKINSLYMLGLSATPNRKDGLTKVLKWFVGDILYQVKTGIKHDVLVEQYILNSENDAYNEEESTFRGTANMSKMINNITEYRHRTNTMIELIARQVAENLKILILSDRRGHLDTIHRLVTEQNICDVGYYVGGMKAKDLKISEGKRLILGTYSMASEGMDIPDLDTLILGSPKTDIIQSVGRILRKKHEDKYAKIIDLVDDFSIFTSQANKRKKYYKQKNYKIITHVIEDSTQLAKFILPAANIQPSSSNLDDREEDEEQESSEECDNPTVSPISAKIEVVEEEIDEDTLTPAQKRKAENAKQKKALMMGYAFN
jgi:superfamily II DNA or RNA helicase